MFICSDSSNPTGFHSVLLSSDDFSNDEYCYPCDVDRFALEYYGKERYNSDEFKDEAYLFIPYDEEYYQGMKKYIDFHYAIFKSKNY